MNYLELLATIYVFFNTVIWTYQLYRDLKKDTLRRQLDHAHDSVRARDQQIEILREINKKLIEAAQ